MDDSEATTTVGKARALNVEDRSYGAFAEIGAGQEVARWFFRAGGAAHTVAKTISAYDMAMSDAIYGKSPRYVSRHRLQAMLENELGQLVNSLGPRRGQDTTFFAFADTVATGRADLDEHGRGWLGIRFQARPFEEPSQIIVHAHLLDHEVNDQQQALGILGVNLVYGAFHKRDDLPQLVCSLVDGLSRRRVEIDMLKASGPAFAGVDNRLLILQLVEQQLTPAAMFTASGEVVQPSEVLHGRPILVERGHFRPATFVTVDLLERARARFLAEPEVAGSAPVVLAEMTLRDLRQEGTVSHEDFLARAEVLHILGFDVLISSFQPYYKLADYLAAYTDRMIGIAVGIPSIRDILDERYYPSLPGGSLESIGRLFKRSVKMYVYPTLDPKSGRLVTISNMELPSPNGYVRDFLIAIGKLEPLDGYAPAFLPIHTTDVLERLQRGDHSWEDMVPSMVVQNIKERRLFGYRE